MIWDEHYLQYKYLSSRLVDVKLRLVGSVGVDALSGQEVDDVLRSVLVAIRGCHLGQTSLVTAGWPLGHLTRSQASVNIICIIFGEIIKDNER